MKNTAVILIFIIVLTGIAKGQNIDLLEKGLLPEFYVEVECSRAELAEISRLFSVDKVSPGQSGNCRARICLTQKDIVGFYELGVPYTVIEGERAWVSMAGSYQELSSEWNRYPTYQAYLETMAAFRDRYPGLCTIDTILSQTPENHSILCARISSNVVEGGKPSIFYSSTIHGDEVVGYYLLIRLIDKLLSEYSTNSAVRELVDNNDIWICPLHNPDGTYRTSDGQINTSPVSTRGNAHDVDLNRSFPLAGGVVAKSPEEPEVAAMTAFLESHNFTVAANLHGGAEVFNYPWDRWMSWQRRHADHEWWQYVGRGYADTCHAFSQNYMTDVDNGVTNGGDWYIIEGSMQDYHNYYHGARHVTIEVSGDKVAPSYMLPYYWAYSSHSLMNFMKEAGNGIHGTVRDSLTGTPLKATVFIENHDIDNSHVATSMPHGDYHRPIKAGTYSVTYSSPGYLPKTVVAEVADGSRVNVDVELVRNTGIVSSAKGVKVYPNPAIGVCRVAFEGVGDAEAVLKMYDSSGRLLLEEQSRGSFDLNVTSCPSGVYSIVVERDGVTYRTRMVKL